MLSIRTHISVAIGLWFTLLFSPQCLASGASRDQLSIDVREDSRHLFIRTINKTSDAIVIPRFAVADPTTTGYWLFLYNAKDKAIYQAWSLPQRKIGGTYPMVELGPGETIEVKVTKAFVSNYFVVDPGCYLFLVKYYRRQAAILIQSSSSSPVTFCVRGGNRP